MPTQHDPVSPRDPRIVRTPRPRTVLGRAVARVRAFFGTGPDVSAVETGRTVAVEKEHPAVRNLGMQTGGLGGPRA